MKNKPVAHTAKQYSNEVSHTPTPWQIEKAPSWNLLEKRNSYTLKVTADGLTVAMLGIDQDANAAYIVRAVNAHEALLQLVKDWVRMIPVMKDHTPAEDSLRGRSLQAIAKAEGNV